MGNLLVICDSEKKYCEKLSSYFRKRKECFFNVISYTDIDLMFEKFNKQEIEILVISESLLEKYESYVVCNSTEGKIKILDNKENEKEIFVNKMILLSETKNMNNVNSLINKSSYLSENKAEIVGNVAESSIYKYQAASGILHSILSEYDYDEVSGSSEKSAEIIGVYSPVKRSLKTSFAYTLSQIINEEENVLYINLEGCSGLNMMLGFEEENNLSDLLFDYSIYREEYPKRFHKFIKSVDGIGIIPPVETLSEIQCIKKEEWISMFGRLKYIDSYKKIVIDIGDNVSGIIDILRICDVIYMPCRNDYISSAKMRNFETGLLKYEESESLYDKIRKLDFPYFNNLSEDLTSLKYSDLGNYVRNII